mgnify:FL=1
MQNNERIKYLVDKLNEYRHLYYNCNDPVVSDEVYDRMFDELKELEGKTGIVYGNSPTNTVGWKPISELKQIHHPIPLLSLDKQKDINKLVEFISKADSSLMYKLDGLTVRLDYENGELVAAGTRGDGDVGDDITHNIPAFANVPIKIGYKGRLSISGEAFIFRDKFEELNKQLPEDKRYKGPRNLAAGTVRAFDPELCRQRGVNFYAFNVLEGLDDVTSKIERLDMLEELGFCVCRRMKLDKDIDAQKLEALFAQMKNEAERANFPIDGMVIQYDNVPFSKSLGYTGHHYRDGYAYKYEDDLYETVLRDVMWNASRSGMLAPVALFDKVEIEGSITHATLHNVTYIKQLQLNIGDRILISKRNMIIPAIEGNLDMHTGMIKLPEFCPSCGAKTEIRKTVSSDGKVTERLYCTNKKCGSAELKQLIHYVDKDSMDIDGLSEGTLAKLKNAGFVSDITDLYRLSEYRTEIINMDGFGEKSYQKMIDSIEKSRNVPFNKFLRAIDIPMIGRHASKTISDRFDGCIEKFEEALFADDPFDFTQLDKIGDIMCQSIYAWFDNDENRSLWNKLKEKMNFIIKSNEEETIMSKTLEGKTIVVTGTVEGYTRNEMNALIVSHGGISGDSVTKKTDILVIAEKPGASKVNKAAQLGTKTMTADEFKSMLGINAGEE